MYIIISFFLVQEVQLLLSHCDKSSNFVKKELRTAVWYFTVERFLLHFDILEM